MFTATTPTPVIILGDDDVARHHCRAQLERYPSAFAITEYALADDLHDIDLTARNGVALIAFSHAVIPSDFAAIARRLRYDAPTLPILVVGPPPALRHPHIAGWISLGSPIDLAGAALVAASGGWVSDRVITFARAQPTVKTLPMRHKKRAA